MRKEKTKKDRKTTKNFISPDWPQRAEKKFTENAGVKNTDITTGEMPGETKTKKCVDQRIALVFCS